LNNYDHLSLEDINAFDNRSCAEEFKKGYNKMLGTLEPPNLSNLEVFE